MRYLRPAVSRPGMCDVTRGIAASVLALCTIAPGSTWAADGAADGVGREAKMIASPAKAATKDAADVSSAEADGYRLDRGDKLRVRFFDRYDRDDLNGDYLIGESGKLRLPRLGLFEVRNKTTAEVEQAVRKTAEARGEKLGTFYVEIAECRPIYVSGLANRPGAYPFTSGLTVVHALALAGGMYRSPMMSAGEGLRERSKVAETLEKLKEPLARKARLESDLAGRPVVAMPADLADLDPESSKAFIQREQVLLDRSREQQARERASLQSMIEYSRSEVDSFDEEIASMTQRISEQSQLFERLKGLYNQKIVNSAQYNQSLVALDSVQRDKQLAIAGVARAKASLEKAKKDLAMVALSSSARVAKELAETDAEISRLKSLAEEQRRLARRLDGVTGRGSDEERLAYRIMRRNASGAIVSMSATETTPLMPGDIIQVDAPRTGARITWQ